MNAEYLVAVGGVLGVILTFAAALLMLPKLRAEARKLAVETDGLIVTRLYAEIERLDKALSALAEEFTAFKNDAGVREADLERENKQLRTKIAQLETRIIAMESVLAGVFKVERNTPEFRELLSKIDEAEAKMNRKASGK